GRLVGQRLSMSLASVSCEMYNTFLAARLLSALSLEAEFGIRAPVVARVIRTGSGGMSATSIIAFLHGVLV
ncbi:MAG TPA: hypothetical protein VGW38_07650, partial [Chloroflexota bacterium]|nr:hypothetical protein [Chloroflexota bacterium]